MSTRVRLALSCSVPTIAMLALGCEQPETPLAQAEQALGSCVTATAGQTQAAAITTQTGVFEASWDVTPSAGTDSGVGFSEVTTPSDWTQLAAVVRFSGSVIDVRDGGAYRADAAMSWTAGATYKVRMIVNVQTDKYSVFVKGPTGNELTLATDYAFRFAAAQLTRSVVITGPTGTSITACEFALSSCVTAGPGATINTAFPQQSGSFSVSWDMTPLTSTIDAAVALAPSTSPSDWADLATIVRFAQTPSNVIDARNGSSYQSATTIPWAVNANYRVRLAVNVNKPASANTYTIFVTPPGGTEQTLGSGYAFRTEQAEATQLQTWVVKSSTGSVLACNFQHPASSTSTYNSEVLADNPVAFWAMTGGTSEADLSNHGRTGSYMNGPLPTVQLPNGESAVKFAGTSQQPQYLSVDTHPSLSIPTTGNLTWEAWISPNPDLQYPYPDYADFIGKCEEYSPTCEWEGRMYNTQVTSDPARCNRISAYAFNPGAGFGAGADWQPSSCSHLVAQHWYHVVGEYTTSTLNQPPDCDSAYPGSINIWVNGVKWDQAYHGETGCMSQYDIIPEAKTSHLRIGTMANGFWFQGAVGKVAIYNYLLPESRILAHYNKMKNQPLNTPPAGNCDDKCTLTAP